MSIQSSFVPSTKYEYHFILNSGKELWQHFNTSDYNYTCRLYQIRLWNPLNVKWLTFPSSSDDDKLNLNSKVLWSEYQEIWCFNTRLTNTKRYCDRRQHRKLEICLQATKSLIVAVRRRRRRRRMCGWCGAHMTIHWTRNVVHCHSIHNIDTLLAKKKSHTAQTTKLYT